MSTFAVESRCISRQTLRGSWTAPVETKEVEMRIVEMAAAGMVAIAAQILVVATVLL